VAGADKEFEVGERAVLIKEIEVVGFVWPMLEMPVVTGPGVYIRALARDIGEKLGTGGYLVELERTRVGEYRKEAALRLGDLTSIDWRFVQEGHS